MEQDNVVISALKKANLDTSILLRAYEIEGSPVETAVEFLGKRPAFGEANLLEEDLVQEPQQVLRGGPYSIKTIKLALDLGWR